MTDDEKRAQLIANMKRRTEEICADPVKLAAWAEKQRKWQEEFDAYMDLETHEGDCYCSRCMSDFIRKHP